MPDDETFDQPLAIEEYGLIGDCASCALVGSNGSIDWLCWPRFDSGACFAALLGDSRNGRWKIAPSAPGTVTRRYRDDSMVLETMFETESGSVRIIDFMVPNAERSSVVRIIEGVRGRVEMRTEISLRFDYGMSVPWVTRLADGSGLCAVAGPELVVLRTGVELKGENMQTVGDFAIAEGERATFVMSHGPSHLDAPDPVDACAALAQTEKTWSDWCARCTYQGEWRDVVLRSLMVSPPRPPPHPSSERRARSPTWRAPRRRYPCGRAISAARIPSRRAAGRAAGTRPPPERCADEPPARQQVGDREGQGAAQDHGRACYLERQGNGGEVVRIDQFHAGGAETRTSARSPRSSRSPTDGLGPTIARLIPCRTKAAIHSGDASVGERRSASLRACRSTIGSSNREITTSAARARGPRERRSGPRGPASE